ncbi:MAG: FG-GAP-like repeat-containing protein [Thermoguttaceae bacterium]|jgi:hypothetical protein
MKDNFFQRMFDRKPHQTGRRTRRLSLESLEKREMLNADWSGFTSENLSTYEPDPTASYSVDLDGSVDACELTDVTGNGRNELVAVDYSTKTISVFSKTGSQGAFSLKGSQRLDSLSGSKGYDSVIIDGNRLTVVSASTGVGITVTEYAWNSATSAYVQSSQTSLDVSKFNSANADICLFVNVDATIINGNTLVVQATTLTTSGTSLKTALYSGYGTSSFGNSVSIVSSISEELMGSTTIGGTDYLILKEATSSSNNLVLANIGTTVSKYNYDLSSYGSALTFNWVAERDGFLVVGAMTGGASGLITIKATTPSNDLDVATLGQWYSCNSLKLNASSAGALGDVGGSTAPEVFVVNGSSSQFYAGSVSTAYDYTFKASGIVVSSPEYVSVEIADLNGDGVKEAILVGANHLYTGTVSDTGAIENVESRYGFKKAVKKAVYGDFNGDGLVDVAVQYQANVGSSVQLFQQLSDGSFVAIAEQSFSGSIVDIAVGKFSQTSVDEVAVLSTKSGSTITSSVNTLKLNGSNLTATRSYTGSNVGAALTAGAIYGTNLDDVVVVNTTQNTITVLRNTGNAFADSTITTTFDPSSTGGSDPIAAAIGDFNGDGLADVAVLNSSAGTNYANIVYYLRSADQGLGSKPSGKMLISNSTSVSGLVSADLNNDGLSDLVYVRKTTGNYTYASALIGNGTRTVFNGAINKALTVDATSAFDLKLARVDSGNVSFDLVWAQDKSVGVLLNADTTEASGSVQFVLQDLSTDAGSSYAEAVSTQRTWFDEWSNFYVDVWVSADGVAATSATTVLSYNPSYFTLEGVEAATGYNVSYTAESGKATITATGSGTLDSAGWVLIGRMKFAPVGGAGVALPADGVLKPVPSGFKATAGSQTINGAAATSVSAPTARLYPFALDIDENGSVNTNDLGYLQSCLGLPVSALTNKKYRVFDMDYNDVVNTNDLAYFLPFLGKDYSDKLDSAYRLEPTVASSSGVLDRTAFCYADLSSDDFEEKIFDEGAVAAIAADCVFCGPTQAPLAVTDDAASIAAFSSIAASEEIQLDVDVDVDF